MAGGALAGLAGNRDTLAATTIPPGRGPGAPGGLGPAERTAARRPAGGPEGGAGAASEIAALAAGGAVGLGRSASSARAAGEPAWAQRMKRGQSAAHGLSLAAHSIRSGDSHGGGASINLSETR